jgi:DNA-binding NarL/FixJ family response regulator
VVQAHADLAAARVALTTGHADAAATCASRALGGFQGLAMPYGVALARLELARALAVVEPELAQEEARTAQAAFRERGAAPALDAAAGLLRELGSGTAPRPRASGELTAREREVLDLVALGMSNARIAASLVISEKTVGHHVSRILAKLGVQNRTEAASHAARASVR